MIRNRLLSAVLVIVPLMTLSKNIALVMYDGDLEDINRSLIEKEIFASINAATTNYYPLKKSNVSYEQILNKNLIEMLRENDFVITFLSGKESQILHEVLEFYNVKHFSLSPENCHWEFDGNFHDVGNCDSLSSEVQEALLVILRHLQGSRLAIIASNETCSLSFSTNLENEILKRNENLPSSKKTATSRFNFSDSVVDVIKIASVLNSVKASNPKVILLATSVESQNIVLQVAAKYQMLGYSNTWIIPGIKDTTSKSLIPMQLITIRRSIERRKKSLLQNEQIILAVKYAMGVVASPASSREGFGLRLVTSSLPCRSNNFSKVEVLAKTDRQSYWTVVYMKDQSRPYKYFTNNGLALSLFAKDAPRRRFRVVTILDPPFTIEKSYLRSRVGSSYRCERGIICSIPNGSVNGSTIWRHSCCIGHSIDLLNLLISKLNFKVDLYIVEDGFYGSLVNGSFNGMIGDVAKGKADIAIAGLTITSLRSTAVDFTSPFMRQDVGIVTLSKKKTLEFINWQFVQQVEKSVIITVFIGILVGTFLAYFMENQEIVLKRIMNPKDFPPRYFWREGFTYYSGLTFQRDLGGQNPAHFGSRVVAIGFAFGMLVIMTTYTAVLTATKVTQDDADPFLGIKDTRMTSPTSQFKFATVTSTSIESLFKNAPDDNFYRMYLFMQKYNARTVAEGIERLRSGDLQAFIHEYPFLLYFISRQQTCQLQITGEPIGQSGFAVALKKGAAWTERLSNEILTLKETGQLKDLDTKWLATTCLEKASTKFSPASLSLEYFGGLVLFVAITFVSMFLLLPLEYAYRRYPRKSIDALARKVSSWNNARKETLQDTATPSLRSVSSELNFISFDVERRPITII